MGSLKVTLLFFISITSVLFMGAVKANDDRSEVRSNYVLKSDKVMPTISNPTQTGSVSSNSSNSGSSSSNIASNNGGSSGSNTSATTKPRYSKNSIQMIVGGQSEDGVAKQIALPIEE